MIRACIISILLLGASAVVLRGASDQPYHAVPIIKTVAPDTAKAGDVLTASGSHLDQTALAKLFVIQGEKTIEVTITNETESDVSFKVPANLAPGRYQLMVLTRAAIPQYLEEPVFFTVQ